MTDLDGTLSGLARLRSGSEPIISLYLDVRWSDEQRRERVRVFVRERARQVLGHSLPGSPGRAELERTLARVVAWVDGLAGQAYEETQSGLALFGCETLGLWRPLLFRRPFRDELCADAIPHLTQLARLADDAGPAIVVAPGPEGADVFSVVLGEVDVEASLRGVVPRRDHDGFAHGAKPAPAAGGGKPGRRRERQEKDARHAGAFVQQNRKAAAAEVTRLFDDRRGSSVVLVGTAEGLAAFERELPERVRAKVIARVPRPPSWNDPAGRRDAVVERAARALDAHERDVEPRIVDAVVGEALRGGLAVVGSEDVVLALNEGRVRRLVVDADLARAGWRCDGCEALGTTDAETCPWCGGALRTVLDLREALVARALGQGAEVEVVAPSRKLRSYEAVGAFLRQTAPTGLRGAPPPWPNAPGASQPP
jgi:hypothetical protein